MNIYKYTDYNEYVNAQIKANRAKLDKVWVQIETIINIQKQYPRATNILCHGVRNGKELTFFQECYPTANIIGTEISPTAKEFKNTVQHDFHNERVEWLSKFDIVYSNSWDHSYDPHKSISAWVNQLNKYGVLIIEYVKIRAKASDPLDISHDEIMILFKSHGLQILSSDAIINGTQVGHLYITTRE